MSNEIAKKKRQVRAYTGRQIAYKRPCSRCGNLKAEKHHPDYDKPLEIIWLCFECHQREHGHGKLTEEERARDWKIARGLRR